MPPPLHHPLRIGLVGAGWVTQHHLAAWKRLEGRARVVAIADPDESRARQRATEFGIEQTYPGALALLDAGGVDAIDVAAPREFHAEVVRLAAARAIPVLCQKPLAPKYGEAEALVAEVAARTRLMVHENWRFRPYYRRLATWIREGRIGNVLHAQMTLLSSGLLPDAAGKFPLIERQPFIATLNRALVTEMAIHHIDTLRFLVGEMEVRSAWLGRGCEAMKGEDRAWVVFETAKGAPVGLFANLRVHGEPPGLVDRLMVVGQHGTIRLAGDLLTCEGAQPAEERFDLPAAYNESYAAAIRHFIDRLEDGGPFETDPRDNLRTLKLVEDIYSLGES